MIPRRSSSNAVVRSRRAFLNASTGECIHVRLPDLRHGHYLFGPTAEGLVVQLHNPLTGQRASLPRATSLLFPTSASKAYRITDEFRVRSASLAGGSSVALHYGNSAVAVATRQARRQVLDAARTRRKPQVSRVLRGPLLLRHLREHLGGAGSHGEPAAAAGGGRRSETTLRPPV